MRKEAAGDLAGLWSGLRCPEEPLCVSLFTGNRVKLQGEWHYFFYFPLWLRLLAKRESWPWAAIYLRNVRWQRHPAEEGVGLSAVQRHYEKRNPERLLLPG